ncbi:MAG TPA: glutamate formimidoyltransferase [Bryobacteraceae bacterium]|jgi:glutamate formiminotransferase
MAGAIECVPNFSEGRDPRVLASLAAGIRDTPGVALLDHSADPDHNRSVFTFTGEAGAVLQAALTAAAIAVARIDLNRHGGVHPRIGALDVAPFVPLSGGDPAEACGQVAHEFGRRLWEGLGVPVFFYEQAAIRPEFGRLEELRRLAKEGAAPDIGEGRHPTAGACAVSARDFLIAWNIWLESTDVSLARQFARAVRQSSGGFAGVKALGLPLESAGLVQVSINTTNFRETPLHVVFEAVAAMAVRAGVRVRGSELIGMIPQSALERSEGHDLQWINLSPSRVLLPVKPAGE